MATVLIVEDSAELALMIQRELEVHAYQVLIARDGLQALRMYSVQTSPCDIRPLVEAIVTRSAPLARRIEKVEIVADIPEEIPTIKADIQRLEQALTNLLHNALRHTPPGGVIAVIVQVQSQRVTISVEDTGEGIAPEELDQIWTRFYQSQHTHTRGGAGLGLVMVKEWIEAMGGIVTVSSILGDGSCFTIDIPRVHAG